MLLSSLRCWAAIHNVPISQTTHQLCHTRWQTRRKTTNTWRQWVSTSARGTLSCSGLSSKQKTFNMCHSNYDLICIFCRCAVHVYILIMHDPDAVTSITDTLLVLKNMSTMHEQVEFKMLWLCSFKSISTIQISALWHLSSPLRFWCANVSISPMKTRRMWT